MDDGLKYGLYEFDKVINGLLSKQKYSEADVVRMSKECFKLSYNFTIQDWKEVRKGDYFEIVDRLGYFDKIGFRLSRIKEYLNTNK